MKLLYLELQAFGAFSSKEQINFEDFSKDRIFLICGKTGSGKTTIFDAISYALFGKTTGEYKSDDMLRSHYANESQETYVKVIFKEKDKVYEVFRKPPYTKPGRKTKIGPEATLKEVEKEEFIANKFSVVTAEVEKIVGFKHEQFRQIVVLPQGEFIKILNSKSDEKEKLLSTLLNTSIYNDITKKLSLEYSDCNKALEFVKSQIDIVYDKYKVSNKEELDTMGKLSLERYQAIKKDYDDLNENLTNKKVELERISNLNQMKNNEDAIKAELLKLQASSLLIDEDKALLKTLNNVKIIKGEYDKFNLHINTKNRYLKSLEIESKKLDDAKIEYAKLNDYISEKNILLSEQVKLAKEKNRINLLKDDNNEINILNNKLDEDKKALKEIDFHLDKNYPEVFKKLVSKYEDKLESLNEENSSYDPLKLERLNSKNNAYQKNIILKKNIETNLEQNDDYKDKIIELTNLIHTQEAELEILSKKFINNSLEAFISLVEEEKPCPLCGSIHHPNIITKSNEYVDEKKLNDLRDKLNNNKIEIGKFEEKIKANNELIAQTKTLLNPEVIDIDIEKLNQDILNEEAKKIKYNENLALKEDTKNLLNSAKDNLDRSTKFIEEKKIEKSIILERISINESQILTLQSKLVNQLNGRSINDYEYDLNNLISTNTIKLEDIDSKILNIEKAYTEANAEYQKTNENLKDVEKDIVLSREMLDSLFNKYLIDEKDYSSYETKIFMISELELRINEYDTKVSNLKAQLKTFEQTLENYEIVDTNILSVEIDNLDNSFKEKKILYEKALKESSEIHNDIQRVSTLIKNNESNIKKFQMVSELFNISNGTFKGVAKITLQKYILGIILDQIIVHANKYLKTFTSNRYILKRIESDSTSYRGLDLAVSDYQTGQDRSVGSLSGGESFMCALALAIGMSEGISYMSGGIKLENIFIDEGFGSLDHEALDNAIEALVTLAANGRTVGIISHVEEIKSRIPLTIEVLKTTKGSKILH